MQNLMTDRSGQRDEIEADVELPGIAWVDCYAVGGNEGTDVALLPRLEEALGRIESDLSCRLVVFHRLGVVSQSSKTHLADPRLYGKREQLLKRFRDLAPLSVALVDGVCSGIQLEIMLGTDACLATESSVFSVPELARGYLPGLSVFRLAKQIGLRPARRLLLTGSLHARDALAQGLIDDICPVSEFRQQVADILSRTASNSLVTTQLSRRLLEESFATSYEDSLGHFLAAQHCCYAKLPAP